MGFGFLTAPTIFSPPPVGNKRTRGANPAQFEGSNRHDGNYKDRWLILLRTMSNFSAVSRDIQGEPAHVSPECERLLVRYARRHEVT